MNQVFNGYVFLALIPLSLVAYSGSYFVAKRKLRSHTGEFHRWLSIVVILAVTIFGRMLKSDSWNEPSWSVTWLWETLSWSDLTDIDSGWLLNAVLFLPAGFVWSRLSRNCTKVVGGLFGLSLAVEILQGWLDLGVPESVDLVTNTLGAVIGALLSKWAQSVFLATEQTKDRPIDSSDRSD